MNKQGKLVNGKVVGGIEWTKTVLPDGTERQGYTFNPIKGCQHGCRWHINGARAICYAEEVAEHGVAAPAYPFGFSHHYFDKNALTAPLSVKKPAKIFLDSMSDFMGHWVPEDQILDVLDVVKKAHWHIFQSLTKNPRRYLTFKDKLPKNLWVGASTPPDEMNGKVLTQGMKETLLRISIETFIQLREDRITWFSAEPLSHDIVPILKEYPKAVDWIVIGAASDGNRYYPPEESHVRRLVEYCDENGIVLFYKGNMTSLKWAKENWRDSFPVMA